VVSFSEIGFAIVLNFGKRERERGREGESQHGNLCTKKAIVDKN
jgi:hypothetical protein